MAWNGYYWLIGFGGTEGGGVVKYDGKSFARLSLPTPTAGRTIVWNGEYWLIGTIASPRFSGSLIRYDGITPIDLTPQVEAALRPSPTIASKVPTEPNVSTPVVSPEPEKSYKNLAFLAVALLIALALYLRWRMKTK